MNTKKIIAGVSIFATIVLSATPAFAHSVVKPATAGVGEFTDFSLSVPSEKPVAITAVKLTIPAGLNFVSPIVKSGWKIEVKQTPDPSGAKDDDGNPAMIVSEMDWTGGQVPAGQKDFFMFSGQVPAQATELDWKVMQTYADGSTASWSLGPNDPQPKDAKGAADFSKFGPYSKTMVVNDLTASAKPAAVQTPASTNKEMKDSSDNSLPLLLSGLAIVVSFVSLGMGFMKKGKDTQTV